MSGTIIFKDPNDLTNGDMILLDSGRLEIYNKIDGVRTTEPTTALRKCVAKSAAINTWTELEGYWQETPRVLLSPKRVPTYYARGRYGAQRCEFGCTIEAMDSPLKYRIFPTCKVIVESGSSGVINANEILPLVSPGLFPFQYSGSIDRDFLWTRPRFGCGSLTINFSYKTAWGDSTSVAVGTADFRHEIYLDVLKIGSAQNLEHTTYQLINETEWKARGSGQSVTKTVSIGNAAYSWSLRKGTFWRNKRYDSSEYITPECSLTLTSYSCSVSKEEVFPTSGEVFYLAIGR